MNNLTVFIWINRLRCSTFVTGGQENPRQNTFKVLKSMILIGQMVESLRIEAKMSKSEVVKVMGISDRSLYYYKEKHDTFTWKEVCLFIDHLGYRLSLIKSFGVDVDIKVDFFAHQDIIPIVGVSPKIDFERTGINNVDGSKSVNVEIKVK